MAERGTATLLLPVGMLLMITLAAIGVDLSHLRAARTDLQQRADAAANDAATAGLDQTALRTTGHYRLDPQLTRSAARRAALLAAPGGLEALAVRVAIVDPRTVRVEVTAAVDLIFAPALPGGPQRISLRATATATTDIQ